MLDLSAILQPGLAGEVKKTVDLDDTTGTSSPLWWAVFTSRTTIPTCGKLSSTTWPGWMDRAFPMKFTTAVASASAWRC